MAKRLFDIIISLIGLIVLSPVFLALSIMITRDSPGGVFFRGERVGQYGKLFRIFKFRSMLPDCEGKGVGQAAWKEIERIHSNIKVWETVTPYFEKRNIHFYVNKLGFHIIEFYNQYQGEALPEGMDEMFHFQKIIK